MAAVHVIDDQLTMNAAAERIIGYRQDEIPTLQTWFERLCGDDTGKLRAAYLRRKALGFSDGVRSSLTRKDGELRLIDYHAAADPAGDVWIMDDVTKVVALQAELVEARDRAEAGARAKSEFLANMSHEIRTPLNGVLTMAQVLCRETLEQHQREKLDVIRQSGEDLLHVINDILDFSKIEAGKLDLEDIAFDPQKVLESTLASFAALAERKDLRLQLDVDPGAVGARRGDPARLRQIVNNFVSNALKFTSEGGVYISIRGWGEGGRDGLIFAVRDTGLGIPAEKMPLLFQKFSQVDASTTRNFGGTGLGLAICRELVVLMGGEVRAESEAGVGSTFYATVALPYADEAKLAQDEEVDFFGDEEIGPVEPASPLKILAAEDNPTNQIVLTTIMNIFGFEVTLVGDGREAVQAWRQQSFDVVLMDVQMPEMDGVEATRMIRAEEAACGLPRTPIIGLSANVFAHQIETYMAVGMDAHVAKPIDIGTLRSVLETVMSASWNVDASRQAA